jgi:hypothetical protein
MYLSYSTARLTSDCHHYTAVPESPHPKARQSHKSKSKACRQGDEKSEMCSITAVHKWAWPICLLRIAFAYQLLTEDHSGKIKIVSIAATSDSMEIRPSPAQSLSAR